MKIEFVKYLKTPQSKFLGIAEVLIEGQILVRYKISEGKNGKGMFPNMASYCVEENGNQSFSPAVFFDSRIFENEIKEKIMREVKKYYPQNTNPTIQKKDEIQFSVFDPKESDPDPVPF